VWPATVASNASGDIQTAAKQPGSSHSQKNAIGSEARYDPASSLMAMLTVRMELDVRVDAEAAADVL
jgi:hypothetical protein